MKGKLSIFSIIGGTEKERDLAKVQSMATYLYCSLSTKGYSQGGKPEKGRSSGRDLSGGKQRKKEGCGKKGHLKQKRNQKRNLRYHGGEKGGKRKFHNVKTKVRIQQGKYNTEK